MSNVIKSNRYVPVEESRTVEAFVYRTPKSPDAEAAPEKEPAAKPHPSEAEAERLLNEAKAAAEAHIRDASKQAERLLADASAQIDKWWNERRAEDLKVVEEAKQAAFRKGSREGQKQAEAAAAARYETKLAEAKQLIEEAHRVKERVISESEPFLVELSMAIARKIIAEQMSVDPKWAVRLVRRTLERRKEKGLITLCVAPSQFTKMQDARPELTLSIDSQADLQIVPDATVDEGGCVVRTSFGSIDARIDTQLSAIKAALAEVTARSEEGANAK